MVDPLPTERTNIFDPPPALSQFCNDRPLRPLAYPDGTTGWLVTGHQLAREILADQRFSARSELLKSPLSSTRVAEVPVGQPAPCGFFVIMDPPDHTRYRKLLAGEFTARKLQGLKPKIEQIFEDKLSTMSKSLPPVDLLNEIAVPATLLVVCELLGIPECDREEFHRNGAVLNSLEATDEQISAAMRSMSDILIDLINRKRAEYVDDFLGRLAISSDLKDDELVGAAILLVVAGHDSTANMLALGTFALLCHPEQRTRLVEGRVSVDNLVEELLRYITITQYGLLRTALEDVEIDGELIKSGDPVTVSISAANRDSLQFDAPDALDLHRNARGHLAFGHGVHQCIGQHLARLEMQVFYTILFKMLPNLQLAVPSDSVPLRHNHLIYGVHRLLVRW